MQQTWQPSVLANVPCRFFQSQLSQCGFNSILRFPRADELTTELKHTQGDQSYRFVDQLPHTEFHDYYENLIAKEHIIPTRVDNWHDFFNGMVWIQFPQAKALISQFHAKDIAAHGLSPRSPRRDRLTHFDECGLLLLVKEQDLVDLDSFFYGLCTHQWDTVFIDGSDLWHNRVIPCLFGHAAAEMYLSPFIGMTAKWLAVPVCDEFEHLSHQQQLHHIDSRLVTMLTHFDGLSSKQILRPIPLLGIPAWYSERQDNEFYQREDYFRAQRKGVPLSEQYPVKWPLQ